jgi:signal peptidase II
MRKYTLFFVVAAIVAALDLGSKEWVFDTLDRGDGRYGSITVIDRVFEIVCHTNPGGMWSIGTDWNPWILKIVRLAAVCVIFVILQQTPKTDRLGVFALGLVMGGAVGNIHDSLRLHAVRDFLKFDFDFPPFDPFPIFNIADSAICVGVALLAIQMVFQPAPQKARTKA